MGNRVISNDANDLKIVDYLFKRNQKNILK